jgi:hypothetical protein
MRASWLRVELLYGRRRICIGFAVAPFARWCRGFHRCADCNPLPRPTFPEPIVGSRERDQLTSIITRCALSCIGDALYLVKIYWMIINANFWRTSSLPVTEWSASAACLLNRTAPACGSGAPSEHSSCVFPLCRRRRSRETALAGTNNRAASCIAAGAYRPKPIQAGTPLPMLEWAATM